MAYINKFPVKGKFDDFGGQFAPETLMPALEELEAAYKKLKLTPLRAGKQDLERAAKDAAYTRRLVANGHSPFQIFMDLNMIARNIKVSSETSETV